MRSSFLFTVVITVACLSLSGCNAFSEAFGEQSDGVATAAGHDDHSGAAGHDEGEHGDHGEGEHEHPKHKIVVTSPVAQDITLTQSYVCQIHSSRHIELRALERGYLQTVAIREGQMVKAGDLLFKILPTLYEAKLDADIAEAQLAAVEYDNTKRLVEKNIVSVQELKLAEAKLAKARAQVKLAQAEVNFTDIKAPYDGMVDRLHEQQGSLIEEGSMLTTLSDNSSMWVYFNVPEADYLDYQASLRNGQPQDQMAIQLRLANHQVFPYPGTIGAIEADFNSETGNVAFRADFPNPDALLRHGQTGTILIHRVSPHAIVIPQRATFEILAKKYAYVVGEDGVVRQREITIQDEQDDIFVVSSGLDVNDKIILEGIRQVRDGDQVEYAFRAPAEVLSDLKYHAE